jgi:uncharacterized protein (TIGR02594 family)
VAVYEMDKKMRTLQITAFDIAERFINTKEIKGAIDNPQVMAMLKLDNTWPQNDEVPWCSAFTNYVCWVLRLTRSKSLMARSWIRIGSYIELKDAQKGFDIIVLKRGSGNQPGADVINAPGHVGFYAGHNKKEIYILGGNQNNEVNISLYNIDRILAIRRLI